MLRVSSSVAWEKAVAQGIPSPPTTSFSNSKYIPFSLIVLGGVAVLPPLVTC